MHALRFESIVFIDEIDAIDTKRYEYNAGGEREIQRFMLELLNQLDRFDSRGHVKVFNAPLRTMGVDGNQPHRLTRSVLGASTGRSSSRYWKIRPRSVSSPSARRSYSVANDVELDGFLTAKDDLTEHALRRCAQGRSATLRERCTHVATEDFRKSKQDVLYRMNDSAPAALRHPFQAPH